MRLETAAIDRYGVLAGCDPDCSNDLTVIAGPNESGKTLYLEGVLQLLDVEVREYLDPSPRVSEQPVGRVVIEHGSNRHVLGETTLSEISPIEPIHLTNLFVIRDSDLVLPEGPDYYTSLVEHLGDIHTTEIELLREELVEIGRLTATTLNVANRDYSTKTVRQDARKLVQEIETYLDRIDADAIRQQVRDRIRLTGELGRIEVELTRQHEAKELAQFEDASTEFDRYKRATERLEALEAFDQESLEELRRLAQRLDTTRNRIERIEKDLDLKESEIAAIRSRRAEVEDEVSRLKQREARIEQLETEVRSFRDRSKELHDSNRMESTARFRQRVVVAGFTGGGIAIAGGAIAGGTVGLVAMGLGLLCLAFAGGAWVSYRLLRRQVNSLELQQTELLNAGRDAGFEVDSVEEIPPMIRQYRDSLESAKERARTLDGRIDEAEKQVDSLRDERHGLSTDIDEITASLKRSLADANADSIDDYANQVEKANQYRDSQTQAAAVLARLLGPTDVEQPPDKAAIWKRRLSKRRSQLEATDVNPELFEQRELNRLAAERDRLSEKKAELEAELTTFRAQIKDFERRAAELTPPPHVDVDPTLEARSVDGLTDLKEQLELVIERIDENADISRKAIDILDSINEAEEQKVTRLFDSNGPASRILEDITSGRYHSVVYDAEKQRIEVERSDGVRLAVKKLSRGTRDQLYFAARLSLAERLLGGDPGFFIFDDPFLAADQTRLRKGFETLTELAERGWQILYLTAKTEVSETMASEFDCHVHRLDIIEY